MIRAVACCCVLSAFCVLGCGGTETKEKPPEAPKTATGPAEPAKTPEKGKQGTNAAQTDLKAD